MPPSGHPLRGFRLSLQGLERRCTSSRVMRSLLFRWRSASWLVLRVPLAPKMAAWHTSPRPTSESTSGATPTTGSHAERWLVWTERRSRCDVPPKACLLATTATASGTWRITPTEAATCLTHSWIRPSRRTSGWKACRVAGRTSLSRHRRSRSRSSSRAPTVPKGLPTRMSQTVTMLCRTGQAAVRARVGTFPAWCPTVSTLCQAGAVAGSGSSTSWRTLRPSRSPRSTRSSSLTLHPRMTSPGHSGRCTGTAVATSNTTSTSCWRTGCRVTDRIV